MTARLIACSLLATLAIIPGGSPAATAEDKKADDGFKPLFNGKDLSGWVNVNCAPETFFVKGGEIVTTGRPTGFLRTDRQYENFVLEMDWMHVNTKEVGNSGLFVWGDPLPAVGDVYTRGIEVQVLVNLEYRDKKTNAVTATSHGDLFSIKGAKCAPDRPHPLGWERCLPSENRAKGGGEWNHYKVTANDGVIKLEVNGKEVSGVSKCNPRKGYLALESEGAECHFKNIRIKELPSTNPKPEECAKLAEGHVSLFNGLDLKGWKTEKDSWKVKDGKLVAAGKEELVSEKKYDKCELVFDCKLPAKTSQWCKGALGNLAYRFAPGGDADLFKDGKLRTLSTGASFGKAGSWNRVVLTFTKSEFVTSVNGQPSLDAHSNEYKPGTIAFTPADGLEITNVLVRELKEKK